MAVGRNRNKITSCALGTFFSTVWLMVFTSPYMYYDANLRPMIGFVYAGTTLLLLAYSLFCVSETTGRTIDELKRFFVELMENTCFLVSPRRRRKGHKSQQHESKNRHKKKYPWPPNSFSSFGASLFKKEFHS
ncbi:hypothetical protein AC578_6609 [Pseudocercospora eumusae]|uniref:Uncharacterized protein n=1 Tax=Pseudocercospora eumusae TaxID=321146 RepID=A0A139GYH9_9PEZI|nr:hypothetical protein AC578_6609 [Pseudocercospora eumusae]